MEKAFCETMGRASYSASMPITGLPEPKLATKQVGIPARPVSTVKPSRLSVSIKSADDLCSWRPSSAYDQIESAMCPKRLWTSSWLSQSRACCLAAETPAGGDGDSSGLDWANDCAGALTNKNETRARMQWRFMVFNSGGDF